ncbi:hypothetical protein BLNAU_6617 [Blattamonas nauphoetae]|uniref:Uncharacterized protein n=1 Tax=Blattamonas nauphoetae TaxID=2049346 RepID=A0ABQ9Y3N4_9EUKA|nr:hypothetical protein BLNAU_6617 [Blattamonas nauphoetae]
MDPNTHQPNTETRKLSLEECLALIEKLGRENTERDAETNLLKEQLKQKDTEINQLKEALEREKEQTIQLLKDKDESNILTLINALTSRPAAEAFDHLHEQPQTGVELVVCVYPHLKAETQIEFLSLLLMLCTSYQEYESQLDALINHPSLEVRLLTLTRWFDLLYSSIKTTSFDVAIRSGGFTEAKIRANLLNAFSLIIEHEREDLQPLLCQLAESIRQVLHKGTQQFFSEGDRQTLSDFKLLSNKHIKKINNWKDLRRNILVTVYILLTNILDSRLPSHLSPQGM